MSLVGIALLSLYVYVVMDVVTTVLEKQQDEKR